MYWVGIPSIKCSKINPPPLDTLDFLTHALVYYRELLVENVSIFYMRYLTERVAHEHLYG